jgi:hypothetical protein
MTLGLAEAIFLMVGFPRKGSANGTSGVIIAVAI